MKGLFLSLAAPV